MHFTIATLAMLAAASAALALPAPLSIQPGYWVANSFQRSCADNICTFDLAINGETNRCQYKVSGSDTPAEHATYSNVPCAGYVVGSAWNDQGFTTLSIVKDGKIIYPSYTGAELQEGKAVGPKIDSAEDLP